MIIVLYCLTLAREAHFSQSAGSGILLFDLPEERGVASHESISERYVVE